MRQGRTPLPVISRWTLALVNLPLVGLTLLGCGQEAPPPPPPPQAAIPQPVGVAGQVPGQVPQPVGVAIPQPGAGGSNFGTITLAPGFMPDPNVSRGTSGGSIDASTLSPACRGWISQQPDHLFVASAPFSNLRVVVNGAGQDTTLVVQRPDGSYACDDDTENRDPVVAGGFPPGTYKIWVGSYTRGESIPYTLGLSELGSTMPSTLGGGAAVGANVGAVVGSAAGLDVSGPAGNFEPVSLNPGFVPDPHVKQGTSGGSIAANTVNPSCAGHVSSRPDHIFTATGAFSSLRIMVRSDADTTLVVRRPDGTFLCDDDTEGTNPVVGGAFPPGQYRIWVGSYSQGENAPYRIGFTELSSVTPSSLQ